MMQPGSGEQTQAPESDLSSFKSGSVWPGSSTLNSLTYGMGIITPTFHDYYED